MAAYEDSYKSQLQGVSQQVARERLDGQLSSQVNMLSDAVTNLRRRPGARFAFSLPAPGGDQFNIGTIAAWDTVVGGVPCQVILNTFSGLITVLSPTYGLLYQSPVTTYLTTADVNDIQVASVGDALYMACLPRKPARGAVVAGPDSAAGGWFYIRAGSFNKTYTVTLTNAITQTFTYKTPLGTGTTDGDLTSPEYIALQIAGAINAVRTTFGVTASVLGAFVFLVRDTGTSALSVTSEGGLSFIVASNKAYIRQDSDLPAKLPATGDGYLMATGDAKSKRYYRYQASTQTWLESGDATSPGTLTNCPIALTCIGGTWAIDSAPFEGRLAGDDITNPDPTFIANGITGMASYQQRLVLMSGNLVYLSASGQPKRFYRSTVTSLLDSDTIGIGSAGATGATFRYGVGFQKDLLLFSSKNQAVIAGSNVALTPRTAAVLPCSEYATDVNMKPLVVGNELMFSAPRSASHFGLMGMLPSTNTESLYVSADATAHLPNYMNGHARFAVSSTVTSMAVFSPSAEPNVLIVHEYIWSEGKKVQQAWHRWEFPLPVATAYFNGSSIVILMATGNTLVGCIVEPKGDRVLGPDYLSFMDLAVMCPVVDHVVTLPAWLLTVLPTDAARAKLVMSEARGTLKGEPVGHTYAAGVFTTLRDYPTGTLCVGLPFTSTVVPTPPMKKDWQGVKVSTNKMTVLRFLVGTNNSGPFHVTVGDGDPDESMGDDYSPVYFYSPQLDPGKPIVGVDSTVVVPARTRAEETLLTLYTDGVRELNLVGLEFVAQYHEKVRRSKGQ